MRVAPGSLQKFLGAPKTLPEDQLKKDAVGIATGLAWTATGGDVLFVEASIMKGKGRLTLTGHLGDVMKESAQAALSWARSHARNHGIKDEIFATHDLHVHVPEGAIPKDGPSAGVTMATAILYRAHGSGGASRGGHAAGEITLRGQVLPIGGLKEKILAARRAGIETIVCPKLNQKDLDGCPATCGAASSSTSWTTGGPAAGPRAPRAEALGGSEGPARRSPHGHAGPSQCRAGGDPVEGPPPRRLDAPPEGDRNGRPTDKVPGTLKNVRFAREFNPPERRPDEGAVTGPVRGRDHGVTSTPLRKAIRPPGAKWSGPDPAAAGRALPV